MRFAQHSSLSAPCSPPRQTIRCTSSHLHAASLRMGKGDQPTTPMHRVNVYAATPVHPTCIVYTRQSSSAACRVPAWMPLLHASSRSLVGGVVHMESVCNRQPAVMPAPPPTARAARRWMDEGEGQRGRYSRAPTVGVCARAYLDGLFRHGVADGASTTSALCGSAAAPSLIANLTPGFSLTGAEAELHPPTHPPQVDTATPRSTPHAAPHLCRGS